MFIKTFARPVRNDIGASSAWDLPLIGVSVGIQEYGGLILVPDSEDPETGEFIPGGLSAPEPADASIVKMPLGYAVAPFGNSGRSCLKTTDPDKNNCSRLEVSVHTGPWTWASKVMAFLDPISQDSQSGMVKLSKFYNVALQVMSTVAMIVFILCIVVLCVVIIFLFVPGT